MTKLFIPFNTPSLKNSRAGHFRSKTVSKYLQKLGVKSYNPSKRTYENYKTRPNLLDEAIKENGFHAYVFGKAYVMEPYDKCLDVSLYFVRDSKRAFDYINAAQIVFDLLVAHGVFPDDSVKYVRPIFDGYRVDPNNPGVYVNII